MLLITLKYPIIVLLLLLIPDGILTLSNHDNILDIVMVAKPEDTQKITAIKSVISDNNFFYGDNSIYNITILEIDERNSFITAKKFCNQLEMTKNLVAVIGVESPPISLIIQSICMKLNMPYIQTIWQANDNFKPTTTALNFHPDPRVIGRALNVIVKNLNWQRFIILYDNQNNLNRLKLLLNLQNYQERTHRQSILIRKLLNGNDQRPLLKQIRKLGDFPIILDCDPMKITEIIRQIQDMKLESFFGNIFLTSLDSHTADFNGFDKISNITTIRIFDRYEHRVDEMVKNWETYEYRRGHIVNFPTNQITTETYLMTQATKFLIDAANLLNDREIAEFQPLSCHNDDGQFPYGPQIITHMKSRNYEFDDFGNRTNFKISVIDGVENEIVAEWYSEKPDDLISLRDEDERYKIFMKNIVNNTIIVSSKLVEPYLMEKQPIPGEFPQGNDRYYGYSKDLIQAIADKIGFDFEIMLTDNGKSGKFDEETETWDGIIGDILEHRAQLGICDMTITPHREEYVDFSMPFMKLGIDVLYKKVQAEVKLFDFLAPFEIDVWLSIGTFLLFASTILHLVSRMAPGDWENPNPNNPDPDELENPFTMKNSLWLTLASIMNVGSDILPKGISSRLVAAMWWLFALIMTNTYTASLAAYLTSAKPIEIKFIEDLAKQNKITYGTLRDGSTEEFFRTSNYSTYIRMYANMKLSEPNVFEDSNADGVRRVRSTKNGLYAFLMESTSIEYEVEKNCDLRTPKKPIYPRSYGIAMPMNYPYRGLIDNAILELQENGTLTDLKLKWWRHNHKDCLEQQEGMELRIDQVGGVFLVLGVGFIVGLLFGIGEFLWNVWKISVDEHVPYFDAFKNEIKFAINVTITEKHVANNNDNNQDVDNESKSNEELENL